MASVAYIAPAGSRVVGDRTLGVLFADPKRPGARDGPGRVKLEISFLFLLLH